MTEDAKQIYNKFFSGLTTEGKLINELLKELKTSTNNNWTVTIKEHSIKIQEVL